MHTLTSLLHSTPQKLYISSLPFIVCSCSLSLHTSILLLSSHTHFSSLLSFAYILLQSCTLPHTHICSFSFTIYSTHVSTLSSYLFITHQKYHLLFSIIIRLFYTCINSLSPFLSIAYEKYHLLFSSIICLFYTCINLLPPFLSIAHQKHHSLHLSIIPSLPSNNIHFCNRSFNFESAFSKCNRCNRKTHF